MAKAKEEAFRGKERYKGGHGALGHPARSMVWLEKSSRVSMYCIPNILMGNCIHFLGLPKQSTTNWGLKTTEIYCLIVLEPEAPN